MAEFDEIPALYEKFRLLISHAFYEDWQKLGEGFGQKGATVKSWGQGGAKHRRGWVPAVHQPKLVSVFEKAFAGYGEERIKRLIRAPLGEFEAELRLLRSASLADLITRHGKNDVCEIFTRAAKSGLVTRSGARQRQAQFTVPAGTPFRLEFRTGLSSAHTCALQHVGKLWGPVESSFDTRARRIHVPGPADDGEPGYMEENDQLDLHRFIILQTRQAFPIAVLESLRLPNVLDPRTLGELAAFLADLKEAERRIFFVDLEIVPKTKQSETEIGQ